MASVFLSYDREDVAKAQGIAHALETAGHSVWWDRNIRGGAQYSKEIEGALDRAEAVVVLWSAHSIDSAWVRDEAAAGRDSGRLVPVSLDHVNAPLGFRQYQTIDLSARKGRAGPKQFQTLLEAVNSLGGPTDPKETVPAIRPAWRLSLYPVLMGVLLMIMVGGALVYWKPWASRSAVPVVAVAAAEPTAASRNLARDLLVRLGSLQSERSDSLNLVEEGRSKGASDLIFQIGKSDTDQQATANLVLLDGTDHSLLWSKDFQQPSNNEADLRQQVAFTAARVMACALEGLAFKGRQIPKQPLKLYLNGCAQISELSGGDPRPVIPIFLAVIKDAPRFEPAWANLLMAEAEMVDFALNNGEATNSHVQQLREHIRDARKLNPAMAEATIAEISLLPATAFRQKLDLVDRAKQVSPNSPIVLTTRSGLLRAVGRMGENVDDAKRAAELDPLSPITRNSYISALAYAGRIDAAREELHRAEQLWPGTKTLQDVQFRFHLRYGDPVKALRLASERGEESRIETFLNAKIHPTPENIRKVITLIGNRLGQPNDFALSYAIQAYGEFDRNQELFAALVNWPNPNALAAVSDLFFRPTLRKFRNDPRFMRIALKAGLVDYWIKSGNWPDFCAEADVTYDCKAEVAKLGPKAR